MSVPGIVFLFKKNILIYEVYIREYIKNDVYQNIISHNSADSPLWILTRTTHKAKLMLGKLI